MYLSKKNIPSNYTVWALKDERAGNNSQIDGVLKELSLPYKIISIKYNIFVILPNLLLALMGGQIHITSKSKHKIHKPWPNIVIACGRRSYLIAKKIKKISNDNALHIQLMNPRFNWSNTNIDLITIPMHDNYKNRINTLVTIGSANKFSNKYLKELRQKNIAHYKQLTHPIIFCIIGGNTNNHKLTFDMANKVLNKALEITGKKGTILITTSRRTEKNVINKIDVVYNTINNNKLIFHPSISNNKNPYEIFMSFADEIIVTGDSISMISEACSTQIPVRIFSSINLCSEKHLSFHDYLIKNNYAVSFDDVLITTNKRRELNTSKKIAAKIKELITIQTKKKEVK